MRPARRACSLAQGPTRRPIAASRLDHTTIFRWTQADAADLQERVRPQLRMSIGSGFGIDLTGLPMQTRPLPKRQDPSMPGQSPVVVTAGILYSQYSYALFSSLCPAGAGPSRLWEPLVQTHLPMQ
jgi:hypothetical protein